MSFFDKIFLKKSQKNLNTERKLYTKGLSFIKEGNISEAIVSFKEAIKIQPGFVQALNGLGKLLSDQGKYVEAIILYDRALMTDPESVAALNNRGIALIKLNLFHDAIRSFDRAILVDPNSSWSLYNKGTLLYQLNRYSESIEPFEKAVQFDPSYVDAWNNLGAAYECLGNYQAAIKAYEKSLKTKPDNNLAGGNKERAIEKFRNCDKSNKKPTQGFPKTDPKEKFVVFSSEDQSKLIDKYCYYGESFAKKEKYREAIEYFEKVLEIDSNRPEALYNKGLCLANIGYNDQALDCFKKFLVAAPPEMGSQVLKVKQLIELMEH